MEEQVISNGMHKFSGICTYCETDKNGFYNKDGYLIIIDNCIYKCLTDPDDGYRSYGEFEKVDDPSIKCTNIFPAQDVLVKFIKTEYKKFYEFINVNNAETVLLIGTDYSEDYYPVAIMYYDPKNLPINIERQTHNFARELQERLVQCCIDYINEIDNKDIDRVIFSADCLQESAKAGYWQPCTDSTCELQKNTDDGYIDYGFSA